MDRRSQYPAHLGCWTQILFCIAYAPLPWVQTESMRLLWILKVDGSPLLWTVGLMVCAAAMMVGVLKKRSSCRHHGLIGCSLLWLAMLISYIAQDMYSPMTATFLVLLIATTQALINDVRRKPRGELENAD